MENANLKELIAVDLDGSDNITEDMLFKFISKYGPQLQGNIHNYLLDCIMVPFHLSICVRNGA